MASTDGSKAKDISNVEVNAADCSAEDRTQNERDVAERREEQEAVIATIPRHQGDTVSMRDGLTRLGISESKSDPSPLPVFEECK